MAAVSRSSFPPAVSAAVEAVGAVGVAGEAEAVVEELVDLVAAVGSAVAVGALAGDAYRVSGNR